MADKKMILSQGRPHSLNIAELAVNYDHNKQLKASA